MSTKKIEIPNALLDKIMSGKVALFIGAGCSIPAGLPSGHMITQDLKKHFSDINQELNDFMEVCQDVEECPPYNRVELEEFILSKLNLFSITDGHKILTKYNWSAIFTTNFDTIIETAYTTTPERLKSCLAISKENPGVNISDRSKIYLFKLMGSMDSYDESSAMVLTKTDYHHSITKRNQYLKLLSDYVKSGVILYLGYSFKDQIAKDVISDVKKLYGADKLPWSYMLMTEVPTDQKNQYFFNQNRIIPIEGDFSTFFLSLNESANNIDSTINKEKIPVATFKIFGKKILINEHNYNMYSSCFDFLYDESMKTNCSITDFLQGNLKSWDAYSKNWDFQRSAFNIKDNSYKLDTVLFEEFSNFDPEKNRILYLTGMPGCGKTISTFRIAYNYFKEGRGPVLLFNRNNNIDFKIIASFIEDVNTQYDKHFKEDEKLAPIKPLLVFDDAVLSLKNLLRLKDYLTSRGRSALILANGRANEIEIQINESNFRIPTTDHFILHETLSETEANLILDYLFKWKFITNKSDKWEKLIHEDYEKSIFATFYSLVHPSRKPLDEIIKSQYLSLSEYGKKAYLTICFFSQYDILVNVELIVRSLDSTYEEFYNILQEVKKLIFEEIDYNGNVTYRTHHRIIAQKTIHFFIDTSKLFEAYHSMLKICLIYNNKEKEVVEKFLIENFSKDAVSNFDLLQKSQLFKAVCDRTPSRSLNHHLGLIEIERQEYEQAENYLLDALDLPREYSELYKGESDQNILTSLGKLNSLIGLMLFRKENYDEAEEKFELAEKYFNEAKHGEYPNAYAYHANAYMWFQKSKLDVQANTDNKFSESISKSLEIINIAKDNLNTNEMLPILELETMIWANFENEQKVMQFVSLIKEKHNSISGYFIHASYYYQKSLSSTQFKELYLNNCLNILSEGLQISPGDEKCLALKCKVTITLNKISDKEMFDILSDWYKNSTSNSSAFLLFNFARLAFINNHYDTARDAFEELQNGIGLGSQNRSKIGTPILDDTTGEPKFFHGEVSDIYSKTDGKIKIGASVSRTFLHFRPIAAKFNASRGVQVNFNIAFSYRGAIAINVAKA